MLKILIIGLMYITFCSTDQSQNTVWLQLENSTKVCGGALIDIDFVILSASCVFDKTRTQINTKALKIIDANETVKAVKQVFVHPNYNKVTLDNNIAILHIEAFDKVEVPSTLTTLVAPVSGKQCVIKALDKNETISVEIPNEPNCAKRLICVKTDDCISTGSILKCDGEVAGVGLKCDEETNEAVFVDVSKYNKWIDQVFRDVVHNNGKDMEKDVPSSTEIDESSEEENEADEESIDEEEKEIVQQCETCYNECFETWTREYFSNQLIRNIYCKRGYYPYGCVYTVKHFIKEQPTSFNPFNAFVTWLVHRHRNFMNYARNVYNTGSSVFVIY